MLRLERVSVAYGERVALHDVSFQVCPGEVVAVLGPNGSGKTTLLRGVLGLATVVSGRVIAFGTPIQDLPDRWRIGYVPQVNRVGDALPTTVAEVVASGRLARRRPWTPAGRADRDAVRAAIAEVDLERLAHRPMRELSGGQQRRALVARALAAEPRLIFMDEPTAGVDRANQELLEGTLVRLAARGLGVVVVTHETAALEAAFTRELTLETGHLVRDRRTRAPHLEEV